MTFQQKKIVIVVGAHRSGTSVITAGMGAIGAYLGFKDLYKSEENTKGFFEHPEIIDFNDSLMEFLGGRWDNYLFDGQYALGLIENKDLDTWYLKAKNIFVKLFQDKCFIALKDPRICQLIPFWSVVFRSLGFKDDNVFYLHVYRHPMEVAKSQYHRWEKNQDFYLLGAQYEETLALWWSMNYQVLRDTLDGMYLNVSYNDYIRAPAEELVRIGKFLGVKVDLLLIKESLSDFVDPSLYRSHLSESDRICVEQNFLKVNEFYELLRDLSVCELKNTFKENVAKYCHPPTSLMGALSSYLTRISNDLQRSRAYLKECSKEKQSLKLMLAENNDECQKFIAQASEDYEKVIDDLREKIQEYKLSLQQMTASYELNLQQVRSENLEVITELNKQLALLLQNNKQMELDYKAYQKNLEGLNQNLTSKNVELSNSVTSLQEDLDVIHRSFSWRLTYP